MIEDLSSYQNHMSLYSFTEKEMTKVRIIEKRDKGAIDLDDVNTGLLCSVRTTYRYLSKYRKHGPPGLIHWLRGRPSNNKSNKLDVIKKYALQEKYKDFGPTLLAETLTEGLWRTDCYINPETLRLKMIDWGTWVSNKQKIKIVRKQRDRKTMKWMMVQFDGSYHIWFENGEGVCMLLSIDDATSELMLWRFTWWESLADILAYRELYFEKFGKPQSLYVDRHATYKVNHERDQFDSEILTRFQRWMQKLWVEIIYTKCPEWKWRIERSFKTHQDRMIKKMRLGWIRIKEEANEYFEKVYKQKHNQKYAVKVAEGWGMHTPLTEKEKKLFKWYFANETERKLRRDGTIWYQNKIYQIKKWEELHDGRKIIIKESIYWEVEIFSSKYEIEIGRVKNKI